MNIAQVKFENLNSSSYYFYDDKIKLKNNITVIVDDSSKGLLFGKVINANVDNSSFKDVKLDKIIRVTNKKDYTKHLSNINDSKSAIDSCKEFVKKNNLVMTILDANYNFDRSQLVFRFVADERVDFRKLAKDLGSFFKTRIELRQVGIRDKAKEIGGYGPCGRLLCCSTFFTSFDSVSINMAKNQSVSLNPSKINGVCGRLLCCLKYENDMYTELKKNIPNIGSIVDYNGDKCKVVSVDIFNNKYKILDEYKNVVEIDNDSQE